MAKTTTQPSPTEIELGKANRKMSELRNRLDTVQGDLEAADRVKQTPGRSAALVLLDGPDSDAEAGPIFDVPALRNEEKTLTDAIGILENRMQDLDRAAVGERYAQRKPEHVELVTAIADRVESLRDALAAEVSFRRQFTTCNGRSVAPAPSLDDCPWLANLLKIGRDVFRRNQQRRGFDLAGKERG